METTEIIRLYTVEHLTQRQIAARAGLSGAAICKRLKAAGVSAQQGEHVTRPCDLCGQPVQRTRCHAKGRRIFCSLEHYIDAIRRPRFKTWRHGQRLAREVVSKYFTLQPGHVVHHHDGNQRHNWPKNLAVFASQAEHMRYHRGGSAAFLWDGRTR